MTKSQPVPQHHYRSILLAVTALVPAVLLACAGRVAGQQAEAERDAAIARQHHIEALLHQLQREQEEIRDRTALLEGFKNRGLVGEFSLAEWTDALRHSRKLARLPALKYEFQPVSTEAGESGLSVHTTRVRLELQLLHEEDLLNFLEHLQREAKAMVLIRACRIMRIHPPSIEPKGPQAQLSAQCEMDWTMAYERGRKSS